MAIGRSCCIPDSCGFKSRLGHYDTDKNNRQVNPWLNDIPNENTRSSTADSIRRASPRPAVAGSGIKSTIPKRHSTKRGKQSTGSSEFPREKIRTPDKHEIGFAAREADTPMVKIHPPPGNFTIGVLLYL